jgi:hypothetical protein
MQLVVDAGALAARVAKVDEKHLILLLEFSTAEDADRIAREVGGPWMREHIRPLLAGGTDRSVAEVVASALGTSCASRFMRDLLPGPILRGASAAP